MTASPHGLYGDLPGATGHPVLPQGARQIAPRQATLGCRRNVAAEEPVL